MVSRAGGDPLTGASANYDGAEEYTTEIAYLVSRGLATAGSYESFIRRGDR